MSDFEQLLAELQGAADESATMAKSLPNENPEDDETVEAAADEANADNDSDKDNDDAPMAKSMTAVIDGEEVEAIDATELLKSLDGRIGKTEDVLAKALTSTVAALKDSQEMIKSLTARLDKLAGQGSGRKTVITVMDKPSVAAASAETLAKSQSNQQEGVAVEEFFAKANSLFESKKLTGLELNTISVCLRERQQIDPKLVQKVVSTNV